MLNMRRILLKLSGESLMRNDGYCIDSKKLTYYVNEIKSVVEKNIQVGIVIGGGNIYRGLQGSERGIDRVEGDFMGMLATLINSIAIKSELIEHGIKAKVLSGIYVDKVADTFSAQKAIEYLNEGNVVIMAGGSGNPFFTTDTAAVLRALEIKADVVIKGTRVNGVYDKDPEKFNDAVKYDIITFDRAIEENLKIMDQTAFTLCKENNLPILVFNINNPGDLSKIIDGNFSVGTIVNS
ncbi:MAG: UMP kinase [Bacteroidales bacterium]|jgi:uridylate kinase